MFMDQLFEPDPMEKSSSPWDLYKGATEDSIILIFKLVLTHHQL